MPASTLKDAYNALDHRQPVRPAQVDELFVERPYSPVRRIQAQLMVSDKRLKLLFIGHRGAGKTSELSYLSTLLAEHFLPVPVPLYEIFKSPSVSHTEVVFAMTLRLLQIATDESIVPEGLVTEIWERLLERSYNAFRRFLFGEADLAADRQRTISLKVKVLVAELETKIGTETITRNQVRQAFEGRVAELLQQIGNITEQLEARLGRNVLLLVEDLDKLNTADTRALFCDHARTLTGAYPSIIYSFPVAMRYDSRFKEIAQGFDDAHLLPNVAVRNRDGTSNPEGRTTMWQILLRRVDADLFEPGVADRLITLSGGHVKTMIQLAQQSVLNAIVDEAAHVAEHHLDQAKAAQRDDYIVLLRQAQIALLRKIHADSAKDLADTTPEKQELLFNGSLLEYEDERGPWADVNPVLLELLERHEGQRT